MLALRQSLTPPQVAHAGEAVCRVVRSRMAMDGTESLCVYASTGKEIPTESLMRNLIAEGILAEAKSDCGRRATHG